MAATGGCVAGGAVGYVISERKSQYATNEAVLDSEIERASALNRMAAERNRQTRLEISRLEKENARLKTASAFTRISLGVMERQKKDIGTQLQLSENTYNELNKEYEIVIAIYEKQKKELASSDARILHLQREVNQLKINIRDVSNSIKQLQRMNESIS